MIVTGSDVISESIQVNKQVYEDRKQVDRQVIGRWGAGEIIDDTIGKVKERYTKG